MTKRKGGIQSWWPLVAILFAIGLWWALAIGLRNNGAPPDTDIKQATLSSKIDSHSRSSLKEALAGDITIALSLLEEWQENANLLSKQGWKGVKHLKPEAIQRARELTHKLLTYSKEELATLREAHRLKEVIDESGVVLDLTDPPLKFLPQTYSSATLLLSMADSDQIVALPHKMRTESDLFPEGKMEAVPMDADRYNSEALFNREPDVAFVASYSLPSTVETLRRQGLKLFSYSKTDGVNEILEGMEKIGNIINRPLKAELMSLFIKGALLHLDNHVLAEGNSMPKRPLYLNAYSQYSTPTLRTLPAELMTRMNRRELLALRDPQGSSEWRLSISLEEMAHLNPDCIIVSTSKKNSEGVVRRLLSEPALAATAAVQERRIVAVDEAIQTSPSQYLVLAYYDLVEAMRQ